LHAEEGRKKVLLRELTDLNEFEKMLALDTKRLAKELERRMADVKELLVRHVPQARQILKKLIQRSIICEPIMEVDEAGFRFSATGTYEALLASLDGTNFGGGGHPQRPSCTGDLRFTIRVVALAA
jgi:hypothetical protein